MHIIYKLVNKTKKKQNINPHSYIGSKMNYVSGKYWGSSHHPVLLQELSENITNFQIEILEFVNDLQKLTNREEHWQKKFQVAENIEYYNLRYTNTKFHTSGMRAYHNPNTLQYGLFPPNKIPTGWVKGRNTKNNTNELRAYYDPNTLQYGLFPPNKIPTGWIKGRKPKSIRNSKSKTGLKKGDPKLAKIRSESNKKSAKKGLDNKSTKIWLLRDPDDNLHTVIGLTPFCKKNNLLVTALQYNASIPKEQRSKITRGSAKGWTVINVKENK